MNKIENNPFYRHTYHCLGEESLAPAGFFEDKNKSGQTILSMQKDKIFHINLHKVISHIAQLPEKTKRCCVLLATGSFNPVHHGHIEMLECAKREMEKIIPVVGGFLSVSHDDYVFTKDKRYQVGASERSWLCDKMLYENSWLTTDTWEALENDYPVNFTDAIERLEWLINLRLRGYGKKVEVVYVFGSDNYRFMDAFIAQGACVCVPRKKSDKEICDKKRQALVEWDLNEPEKRIFISEPSHEVSSTEIRNSHFEEMIKKSNFENKQTYHSWHNCLPSSLPYLIRDDSKECTRFYANHIPDYQSRIARFKKSLLEIFSQYFHVKILRIDCAYARLFKNKSRQIINLDTWTDIENSQPLRVSRVFHINDAQIYSKELHVNQWQLESLKKQDFTSYSLVDDDISSGFTTRSVEALLAPKKCEEMISMNPYEKFYDIVDIRDFIVGSEYGGLYCHGDIRVPYLYPFVNLFARAKIPLGEEKNFTQKVILLNMALFDNSSVEISMLSAQFQRFAHMLGCSNHCRIFELLLKMQSL